MDLSFSDQIAQLQSQYYANNTRNTLFKSNQKMDCAAEISQKIDIQTLLEKTAFIIPETNQVFFDYTIFKLYANPSNYPAIVQRTLLLFRTCIETYGTFEAHINMKSFSISAAQRYRDMINFFCEECFKSNLGYSPRITQMCIYHTPNMVDSISALLLPFIEKNVQDKIVLISKQDSDSKIASLFGSST